MKIIKNLFHNGYQKITAEEAKEMMEHQDVIIIDVREEHEYISGHIPGSLLYPLNNIDKDHITIDKNKVLLVYCRSGRRSQKAAMKFVKLGYKHVYDFGGIIDWPYTIEE